MISDYSNHRPFDKHIDKLLCLNLFYEQVLSKHDFAIGN